MKRATICSQSNFETDYRIHKMAETLRSAGYEVRFLGRSHPHDPRKETADTHIMRLLFWHGPLFYAELNLRIFLYLLFSRRDDLVVSIDLDTLAGCLMATKLRRERLMFDSHEYFPEVPEIANKPFVKRVWNAVQDFCVPRIGGDLLVTVCQSIADVFQQKYGRRFLVVRNVPLAERALNVEPHVRKEGEPFELLYQGAVNVGRGLEETLEAMKELTECRLTVVGGGDLLGEMQKKAEELGVSERVTFTGRKPFTELGEYMSRADLGLVLLRDISLNYHYALPNRIFDFIQAGLPILGSDLPEISRIVRQEEVGMCIDSLCAEEIVRAVREIMGDTEKIDFWRENMRRVATESTWERETEILRRGIIDNL